MVENSIKENINVIIIGSGPHSERTYYPFCSKFNINPVAVIDLESMKERVEKDINIYGWNSEMIFLEDQFRDALQLPKKMIDSLNQLIEDKHVNYVIISTEPKGHMMYIDFFSKKSVHMLIEKPITAPRTLHTLEDVALIKESYEKIIRQRNPEFQCKVMCQRKFNQGYIFIRQLLIDVISKHNIPITSLLINHCDGNWILPHDLFYENHPYKYGYGKLFHSGYHFIDLLCDLVKLNGYITKEKQITSARLFSSFQMAKDDSAIVSKSDLFRLFQGQEIPEYYKDDKNCIDYSEMGEKNIYTQIEFKNAQGANICVANLNIGQIGFSRRGWAITHKDHYKDNGRVRHEHINIQVGPLMNIQVHSYQSKEIKDRAKEEFGFGGLDHFDIDIFRNSEIIGGIPYERISAKSLMQESNIGTKGLNEDSREIFLQDFFSKNPSNMGDIEEHKLGIEFLYRICLQGINTRNNQNSAIAFNINHLLNYYDKKG